MRISVRIKMCASDSYWRKWLDIAEYLKVDTTTEKIIFGGHSNGRELYLTLGIDCVVLNYTKSENYKALLEKIEVIVNENFKSK